MPNISLESMQACLSPFDLVINSAPILYFDRLEVDIDEADRFDLGQTWRRDWREELRATLTNSTSTFVAESKNHEGFAIFGVTPVWEDAAQIWLIQSKTFSEAAFAYYRSAWPRRGVALAKATIELFADSYSTLFNFISSKQENNVRWLYASGFKFYRNDLYDSDMLMFAVGEQAVRLAADKDTWISFLGERDPER